MHWYEHLVKFYSLWYRKMQFRYNCFVGHYDLLITVFVGIILLSISQKLLPSVLVSCYWGGGVSVRRVLVLWEGSSDSLSLFCRRSSQEARGGRAAVATAVATASRTRGRTGGHHQLQSQSAHCSQGKALENDYNGSCWFLLMSPFNLENRACPFSIFTVNLILMRQAHSWFDFNEENGLQYLKPICSILTVLLSITYSDSDPYFRHFLIC